MAASWENVKVDGSNMRTYVSAPDGSSKVPGIVVVQGQTGVDDFLEFTRMVAGEGFVGAAPDLYHRDPPGCKDDAPTRRMRLDFDERAGFLIDQTPYRIDENAFSVGRGTREVWEIKNSPISMPHPMHLHGFGFRVLRRQGTYGGARRLATESGARFPTDLGVKDTVLLWPNETVWLATDFTLPEERTFRGAQRYMLHCHNLEHEDGMMMRNFTVI